MAAIEHDEPDRVPIDLGGTVVTGIHSLALDELLDYLDIRQGPVKVFDVFQMLGRVELDLVEEFHVDVLPIFLPAPWFGIKAHNFKLWEFHGKEILVPEDFNVEIDEKGNYFLRQAGDPENPVAAKMPKSGYYFEDISYLKRDEEFEPPPLEEVEGENLLSDEELSHLAERAKYLRKNTDKALILDCMTKVGFPGVGSLTDFLMMIASDPEYMKELMQVRENDLIENLKRMWDAVGDNADIVVIDGVDYGSQERELISPKDFEEIFFPHHCNVNSWVHQNTSWKTFQHCDGSITELLPMFVESGLDILNPIQIQTKGMDPKWIKKEFGEDFAFWGGGVNNQKTLPFGTPDEVKEDVKGKVDIFSPGGGYIFNTIHNIQAETPPQNIEAAFESAFKYGRY